MKEKGELQHPLPEDPKKEPWDGSYWFSDLPCDEVTRKKEIKAISGLINNLVVFVSLSKNAVKQDAAFAGLPAIRTGAQESKSGAVQAIKELLKMWGISTG
ncbi:hypothetical protein ES705_18361 [subsurface metagenome]